VFTTKDTKHTKEEDDGPATALRDLCDRCGSKIRQGNRQVKFSASSMLPVPL
jgi:hypothetical protein